MQIGASLMFSVSLISLIQLQFIIVFASGSIQFAFAELLMIHAASFSLVCWIDFRQFPFWREKLNAESIYNNKQTELIKAALNDYWRVSFMN